MNYSQTILDNGFSFESGNNGNINMSLRLITGESWAPEWLDDLNGNPVTDIVVDFGNRTVWTAKDVADVTGNIPIEASSDGTNNYLANYSGSTKRTGYLLETNRGLSSAGLFQQVLPVTQPLSITGIPYYSYTHECYDSSGDVTTRASTAAVTTSTGEFVYDQTVLDTTSVAAEGSLLNSRTLATATSLTMTDLDDLYAILKSTAYNNRDTSVQFSVVGSKISIGTGLWTLTTGATSLTSTNTNVKTSTTLTGGSLFDGFIGNAFRSFLAVTFSGDVSIDMATSINMNNTTDGASTNLFKAPTITNIPTTLKSKYQNTNTITSSSSITSESTSEVTGNLTITTGGNNLGGKFGANVTVTGTGDNTVSAPVTGNISMTSTGNQTFTSTASCVDLTLSGGVYVIDGTVTGSTSIGNGNAAVNGSLKTTTHGTGTFTMGAGGSLTGTLTKSGSGSSNGLTLTSVQASTIDLVVPTGTLELFGAGRANFKSVSGLTSDNLAATTTSFVVESDKASGAYVLRNTTDGVEIANGLHTAGVTTTVATITNVTSGSKTYSLLYKPNNVTTGTIAQQRFGQTYNVTANNDAAMNTTVGAVEQYHAETLTALAEAADSSAVTMLFVLTGDTAKAEITVAGTNTNRALVVVTQRATLISLDNVVGGKSQYLTFLSVNDMNRDIVVPAQGNIIEFDNENDQLLYTSAVALTVQQITGAIALSSTDNTTASITSTDGSLAVPGVIIYDSPIVTDAQLVAASEQATDGIANGMGYLISGDSALVGIAPKDADYATGTDYKDNL